MNPNQFRDPLPLDEGIEPSGEFAADLRNFCAVVNRAAERETLRLFGPDWLKTAKRRQRSAQRRLVLAWSTAALLCIGVLPFLHQAKTVAPSVATGTRSYAEDTALLEQVDSAVSESVPQSLAPLAALDDWSGTASTNTEPSLNQPEKKNVAQ
jgi:hypothetical protein